MEITMIRVNQVTGIYRKEDIESDREGIAEGVDTRKLRLNRYEATDKRKILCKPLQQFQYLVPCDNAGTRFPSAASKLQSRRQLTKAQDVH